MIFVSHQLEKQVLLLTPLYPFYYEEVVVFKSRNANDL